MKILIGILSMLLVLQLIAPLLMCTLFTSEDIDRDVFFYSLLIQIFMVTDIALYKMPLRKKFYFWIYSNISFTIINILGFLILKITNYPFHISNILLVGVYGPIILFMGIIMLFCISKLCKPSLDQNLIE